MPLPHRRGRVVASSLLLAALPAADELPPLTVTAPAVPPGTVPWQAGPPASDVAAWLRGQPGVRAVRMGGHGLDPVIDGQGGARLRVTLDGAPVHGGCPNRMDPPTSYAPAGSADEVVLMRGRGDVREAGGSAGSLRIERRVPLLARGGEIVGRVGGAVAGRGTLRQGWADVSAGDHRGGVRAIGGVGAAGDYEDGDGATIRSSWRQAHGTVLGAWRPADGQEHRLGGSVVQERDVAFAGAAMDAPESDLLLVHAGTAQRLGDWRLDLRGWRSQVDHVMDNYSLRPLTAPMAMRAVTAADVGGGRVDLERVAGAARPALGVDVEIQDLDGVRTRAATPGATPILESVLWPDVRLARVGAYAEAGWSDGPWTGAIGLRLDAVHSAADAREATLTGGRLSPAQLYRLYYGSDGGERTEWLPAAVVRLERTVAAHGKVGLTLGRTMRAAEVNERFLALNGTPATNRWVGNPAIGAEAHHQARLVAAWRAPGALALEATAFADRVDNHILRDRARGQDGILAADGASVYRNTDALLVGGGVAADWRVVLVLSVAATVDAVRSEDLGRDLPLAQIPPLSGTVTLRGHLLRNRLEPALVVRWADDQQRVDDDPATGGAVDPGPTPGWAVLDARLTWRLAAGEVTLGCDNAFDRAYTDHLAKADVFDLTVARVNEPGRSVWLASELRF